VSADQSGHYAKHEALCGLCPDTASGCPDTEEISCILNDLNADFLTKSISFCHRNVANIKKKKKKKLTLEFGGVSSLFLTRAPCIYFYPI
jgi:hypothetical protein